MKKRVIKKLKETPVKKKIGPPSKNIQKTLTSFFKPSGNKDFEDPNKIKSGGVKRSSNDSEKFSKVILIDIDSTTCESDKMDHVKGDVSSNEIGSTDVCQQTEDKVVRAPSAGGCIIEDSTLSESDQLVRSEITATSTPMPGGVELCLEDDARCPRILFSPVLSIPKECDGVDDLSRLSELFEDLSTSFVDHLDLTLKATDDIELQQGVHKYIVLQVQQLQVYDNLQNLFIDAKKLELKSITNDFQANCLLMDDWFNTEIAINCRINLILLQSQKYPLNASTNTLEISIGATSENVYLIAYPDTLLSGSVVSGSFFCERKTILQDFIRIKETDLAKHALFGTICHEIFQQALVSNEFGMKALEQASLKISTAVSYLESFAFLGLTAADVLENANKHLSHFSDFGRKFINSQPTFLNGKIDLPWKGDCRDQTESAVAITEVLDIEESVWSPSYGLKGKIDASVSVKIHKRTKGLPNLLTQELVIPFELKTGKMTHSKGSNEHRAQLMLYTLLMGEKMHAGVPVGLLYYSITGHLQGVPANFQEIKGILQRRNELASYLHSFSSSKSPRLPPMLREPRICSKCSHLDACLLLHQNLEGGGEFSSGLGSTFSESVGKLTDDDKSYFTKWFEMIHLESKMEYRDNQVSEIWTKTSQEREALGQCLGRMVIKSSLKSEGGWKTTLVRHHTHLTKLDLEECSITAGDSLIVSYEDLSQLGIAWCSVVQLTNCEVVVESGANNLKKHDCNLDGDVNQFRLDKCDTYRPSSIVLMNLVSFFKSNERSYKLRQLIIHKSPPSFNIVRPLPSETLKIYSHLNTEQQSIIERVLASSDYLIVQGMPGTGKTTLTASLIRVLLSQNCTILLSSYTNTALDNILLKLVEFGVDFVRIGKKSSVHPTISKYLPQTCLKDVKTIEEVASFYNDKHLYAATCLSITNDFVQKKAFDWCIVDEASQLTQFLCLGPILLAKRFVLVGDLHQLPPLVRNVEARREGYNISLFRQLSEDHPRSVLTLSSQYRMNESVMSISNHIIYEKRMQAAERIVSEGKLSIPSWGLTVENPPDTWLLSCIHPDKPVVFIDTDSLESQEVEINQRVCNQIEANILQQIVSTLIMLGISSEQIGIITPYRQQVRLLNSTVGQSLGGSIEISTVDRFQGRDKDCILVSTVRNNAEGKVGELLPDRHRLNVMITRAKYKLIIVGSTRTLRHCEIFKELIEFFEGKQWIHTLQKEQFSVFNSTSQSVCT